MIYGAYINVSVILCDNLHGDCVLFFLSLKLNLSQLLRKLVMLLACYKHLNAADKNLK